MINLDEYWTLRNAAAVVRRSDRGVIDVTGRDRATWLQGLLTNDVLALGEGESCYSAYLTPQGRMITDMQVIALADRMWLDVPAPLVPSLRERLDGLIFAEDAQVIDASESVAVWGLYGPDTEQATLKGRLHTNPSGLPRAVPDSTFGVPGFTIYMSSDAALPVDVRQASLETLDVLRIEAGTPKFLVDMTEDTIPLEAGIEERAISFTKGCYVGQEVIVRVTHRGGGRVAKRLVRWTGPPSPPLGGSGEVSPKLAGDFERAEADSAGSGARIFAGAREIGRVTSAAFSPLHNVTVGLGYVHRDFVAEGTALTIETAAGHIDAVVS